MSERQFTRDLAIGNIIGGSARWGPKKPFALAWLLRLQEQRISGAVVKVLFPLPPKRSANASAAPEGSGWRYASTIRGAPIAAASRPARHRGSVAWRRARPPVGRDAHIPELWTLSTRWRRDLAQSLDRTPLALRPTASPDQSIALPSQAIGRFSAIPASSAFRRRYARAPRHTD